MKPLILLVALATLSACNSGPTRAQIEAQDDGYCLSLGFKHGTDGYGNCRLQRTQMRLSAIDSEPSIRVCHNYGYSTTCF